MSVNTAHANGGLLIYNGERIMLYCDDVEVSIDNNNDIHFKGKKKGRLFLTSHRMIFNNNDKKDQLQSFSFPFFTIKEVELEQPIFGANFIKGKVNAQAQGNWTGSAVFKLNFKKGGAIEYGQAMLQAARMAGSNMPSEPPPYTPMTGPFYAAPPPAYAPPPPGYMGFTPPTHVFPTAPPMDGVYMSNQPPPYPGIYGQVAAPGYGPPVPTGPPLQSGFMNGHVPPPQTNGFMPTQIQPPQFNVDWKAQEAARSYQPQSAYYDPNNPHMAYVSPPPYYASAPPSYDDANKKAN